MSKQVLLQRPRIGFVGVGWIGRHRMQAIAATEAVDAVAIVDASAEAAQACVALLPQAQLCTFDDLLTLGVDAVVIATPSALHAQQCINALSAGCAVFCQKPLARNALETAAVLAAARAHDRLLGVDFSYRFVRGVSRMRELIAGGELGDMFAAQLVFHNAYGPDKPWFYQPQLSGGGCLIDLGTHLIDLADYLLGGLDVASAQARTYVQGRAATRAEVEDYATARLTLRNGAAISIDCSWRLHAGQDAVIEASFYGTQGAVRLRNVNGSFFDFIVEQLHGTQRTVLAEPPDEWGGRAAAAWARQLAHDASYDESVESTLRIATILDQLYLT